MAEETRLSGRLNDFSGYIAILLFIASLLTYAFVAGTWADDIANLEADYEELKIENKDINIRLDEQFGIIQASDAKLILLLDYFNITDSTRHH